MARAPYLAAPCRMSRRPCEVRSWSRPLYRWPTSRWGYRTCLSSTRLRSRESLRVCRECQDKLQLQAFCQDKATRFRNLVWAEGDAPFNFYHMSALFNRSHYCPLTASTSSNRMITRLTAAPGPRGKSNCDLGTSKATLFPGVVGSARWKAGMNHAHPIGKEPRWSLRRNSRPRSSTTSCEGTRWCTLYSSCRQPVRQEPDNLPPLLVREPPLWQHRGHQVPGGQRL